MSAETNLGVHFRCNRGSATSLVADLLASLHETYFKQTNRTDLLEVSIVPSTSFKEEEQKYTEVRVSLTEFNISISVESRLTYSKDPIQTLGIEYDIENVTDIQNDLRNLQIALLTDRTKYTDFLDSTDLFVSYQEHAADLYGVI